MRRHRHLVTIAFLLCALAPSNAAGEPTAADIEQAENFYVAGVDCYRDKNFRQAADLFRKSYNLVAKPTLLYNEAYAWALAGDMDRARAVADESLTLGLTPDLHAKVTSRLLAWDAVEAAQRPRPIAFTPKPIAVGPAVSADTIKPQAPRPEKRTSAPTAPLILGATALGSFAAAGILEWQVAQASKDLMRANARRDATSYDAALQRGERLQTAGKVTLVAGGVLLGATIVVWLVTRGKQARAAVQPDRFAFTF